MRNRTAIYRLIYILSGLSVSLFSLAQDSLRMRTGAVYAVKIIEISENQIQYRTYSNPNGPLYTLGKTSIAEYKLQGGTWETFSVPVKTGSVAGRTPRKNDEDAPRHYIALNVLDLIRTDLTIFYEIQLTQRVGIRIPARYGFRNAYLNPTTSPTNPFAHRRNVVFETGTDFRFFSGHPSNTVRFVYGPAIHYLRTNGLAYGYQTFDPENMVFQPYNNIRILFYTGLVIRPGDKFQIGFDNGFGGDIQFIKGVAGAAYITKVQFNLHVGYRF